MAHELLVGLTVTDDEGYARYRAAMTPLLHAYGGGFRYDFTIAKVLRSASDHPINRLFVLRFPSKERIKEFFANPAYQAIKAEHFAGSVAATTILAAYDA
jgi:uncharacterized protein (DUF1330 family)